MKNLFNQSIYLYNNVGDAYTEAHPEVEENSLYTETFLKGIYYTLDKSYITRLLGKESDDTLLLYIPLTVQATNRGSSPTRYLDPDTFNADITEVPQEDIVAGKHSIHTYKTGDILSFRAIPYSDTSSINSIVRNTGLKTFTITSIVYHDINSKLAHFKITAR